MLSMFRIRHFEIRTLPSFRLGLFSWYKGSHHRHTRFFSSIYPPSLTSASAPTSWFPPFFCSHWHKRHLNRNNNVGRKKIEIDERFKIYIAKNHQRLGIFSFLLCYLFFLGGKGFQLNNLPPGFYSQLFPIKAAGLCGGGLLGRLAPHRDNPYRIFFRMNGPGRTLGVLHYGAIKKAEVEARERLRILGMIFST